MDKYKGLDLECLNRHASYDATNDEEWNLIFNSIIKYSQLKNTLRSPCNWGNHNG